MQTLILPVTHAILGIICQLRYDIPQACPVLSKPGAFGRVATVKCKYKYKIYEYIRPITQTSDPKKIQVPGWEGTNDSTLIPKLATKCQNPITN